MKEYPVHKDDMGERVVTVNVTLPITIYLDEDDERTSLSAEDVDEYVNEMERTDLGEQVLNHLSDALYPSEPTTFGNSKLCETCMRAGPRCICK